VTVAEETILEVRIVGIVTEKRHRSSQEVVKKEPVEKHQSQEALIINK
jgi:hypothetical protein